ncbi:hypothetical protein YWY31_27460 [Paenibacillus illinoisensis]
MFKLISAIGTITLPTLISEYSAIDAAEFIHAGPFSYTSIWSSQASKHPFSPKQPSAQRSKMTDM